MIDDANLFDALRKIPLETLKKHPRLSTVTLNRRKCESEIANLLLSEQLIPIVRHVMLISAPSIDFFFPFSSHVSVALPSKAFPHLNVAVSLFETENWGENLLCGFNNFRGAAVAVVRARIFHKYEV